MRILFLDSAGVYSTKRHLMHLAVKLGEKFASKDFSFLSKFRQFSTSNFGNFDPNYQIQQSIKRFSAAHLISAKLPRTLSLKILEEFDLKFKYTGM